MSDYDYKKLAKQVADAGGDSKLVREVMDLDRANKGIGALPLDFPAIHDLVWETTGTVGDTVTYQVTVGEGVLKGLTSHDLDSFARFNRACMDQLGNPLPSTVSRGIWPDFIRQLFKNKRRVDRPQEGGPYGTFITYLTEFKEMASKGKRGIKELPNGYPGIIGNRVWFRLRDLQAFLRDKRFFFKEHELLAYLDQAGGTKHDQQKIQGTVIRPWSVPIADMRTGTGVIPTVTEDPDRAF